MNKPKQKPIDMFNKQDVTVNLKYAKMLKSTTFSISHSRIHFQSL